VILAARKEAAFKDLNDFAQRVDLRHVGRRAIESLIKVGALDKFGARLPLLESMDRIIAISSSYFRAAESGQMSLFGEGTGFVDSIDLPDETFEVSRREVLSWERELIGLYISDHPLNPVMEQLDSVITHYSGELLDVTQDERVRVAGLITAVRHHQTKAGKPMGFVKLEDVQGVVDLVVFPRTWAKSAEQFQMDNIVLVDGRIDPKGAEPKILVDKVTTEFSVLTENEAKTKPVMDKSPTITAEPIDNQPENGSSIIKSNGLDAGLSADTHAPKDMQKETQPILPDEMDWDSMPPPPEPPPDWEINEKTQPTKPPSAQDDSKPISSGLNKKSPILPDPGDLDTLINVEEEIQDSLVHAKGEEKLDGQDTKEHFDSMMSAQPIDIEADDPISQPPIIAPKSSGDDGKRHSSYLVPPQPADAESDEAVRMLTVVLRSTGDKLRDVLRLRRIHGIITSYPGSDRFGVHVFERGHGYLMEFPNFTCGASTELINRLSDLLGTENVRVEKITFQ